MNGTDLQLVDPVTPRVHSSRATYLAAAELGRMVLSQFVRCEHAFQTSSRTLKQLKGTDKVCPHCPLLLKKWDMGPLFVHWLCILYDILIYLFYLFILFL